MSQHVFIIIQRSSGIKHFLDLTVLNVLLSSLLLTSICFPSIVPSPSCLCCSAHPQTCPTYNPLTLVCSFTPFPLCLPSHRTSHHWSSLIWTRPRVHCACGGFFFLPKINSCLYVAYIRRTGGVQASSHFHFGSGGSILTRPNVEGGTVLTCRCVKNRWRTEPSAWQLMVSWDVSEHSCVLVLGEASVVTLLVHVWVS